MIMFILANSSVHKDTDMFDLLHEVVQMDEIVPDRNRNMSVT